MAIADQRTQPHTHVYRNGVDNRNGNTGVTIGVLERARHRAVCILLVCNEAIDSMSMCSEMVLMSRYENTGDRITHTPTKRHGGARATGRLIR